MIRLYLATALLCSAGATLGILTHRPWWITALFIAAAITNLLAAAVQGHPEPPVINVIETPQRRWRR